MIGPELFSHLHVSYSNQDCLSKGQFIFLAHISWAGGRKKKAI